jgi:hypothetical protein
VLRRPAVPVKAAVAPALRRLAQVAARQLLPAGWAVAAVTWARAVVAAPRPPAAEPSCRVVLAANSAPCQPVPCPAPPRPRVRTAPEGPAELPRRAWWHSPWWSPAAVAVAAEPRCRGRTARARHSATTDPRSALLRLYAGHWCGRKSARWQYWRGQRGRAARASAAPRKDRGRVGRRRAAAAAPRRSCRPAGRATSSPGLSSRGAKRSHPTAERAPAKGRNAGQRCRIRGRNQLEPVFPPP